ncbi:hypothetical protein Rhal01_00544 [Rubritalea halochordaticola]|uniref:ATP-binding protein n=1 Tax=Rubritalea halochordaticola TaxID=714537 RepID=A0ABP9UV87_9BACT
MSSYFDVSSKDIAQLSDEDLRELVAKLCEADYRAASLPVKGIIWGGEQDAKDGGFDVVVDDTVAPPENSFILRPYTCFQVKKPKMPPSAIKKELLKNGKFPKSVYDSLVKRKGAYITVSSGDSCPKATGLDSRKNELRSIFSSVKGGDKVEVDFIDSNRLATWTRLHPGIMLWVLSKSGREGHGWRSYGNWANSSDGVEGEYLLSDEARLKDDTHNNTEGFSISDGLNHLRASLKNAQSSVRLVGLSGVGKTRLVQALFDDRVGHDPLHRDLVYYTDLADDPNPEPKQFVSQLISQGYSGVIIVDNCSRELHSKLTQLCGQEGSQLSLLTIEYDVRDHLPEETKVYRLDPTGEELICKLLERKFSELGSINARKIAECSGGNFRVAISLAKTVTRKESLATLRDDELFVRLFKQGNKEDQNLLLKSGEVLSLLYSFDGEDVSESGSELSILGSLIDVKPSVLYRDSEELAQRDLVQKRNKWRAILPHAVANNLAKRALAAIPRMTLLSTVFSSNERVIRSFSRRLSYLHDSTKAVEIAAEILGENGWLGMQLENLNSLGVDVFLNVAPLSREATLKAIESLIRQCQAGGIEISKCPHSRCFSSTLYHLAYDDDLFERSVIGLYEFAKTEEQSNDMSSPLNLMLALFRPYLSGSHASIETRCLVIMNFLNSSDPHNQSIGVRLLTEALRTGSFMGATNYDFGARPRDYGAYPRTYAEQKKWYNTFLNLGSQFTHLDTQLGGEMRKVLARSFRGLWRCGHQSELESIADKILNNSRTWVEGWGAAMRTLRYDGDKQADDKLIRLKKLIKDLKPDSLEDKLKIFIFGEQRINFDPEMDDPDIAASEKPYQRVSEIVRELGKEASKDKDYLTLIACEVVSEFHYRSDDLGEGLALANTDFREIWDIFVTAYKGSNSPRKNAQIFCGMMRGLYVIDRSLYFQMLDEIENNKFLAPFIIIFQSLCEYDQDELTRLHRILDGGLVPISSFRDLACGRRHEKISDKSLVALLRKIFEKDDGSRIALDILKMRFLGVEGNGYKPSAQIVTFSIDLLLSIKLDNTYAYGESLDHEISRVARVAFKAKSKYTKAKEFCRRLTYGIDSPVVYNCYHETLEIMAQLQPKAFLEGWLDNNSTEAIEWFARDSYSGRTRCEIISQIDQSILFDWINENRSERFSKVAMVIDIFNYNGESATDWTPLALKLIKAHDTPKDMVKMFIERFYPSCWSGSRAEIIDSKLALLKQLPEDLFDLRQIDDEIMELDRIVQSERESEARRSRQEDQSFE